MVENVMSALKDSMLDSDDSSEDSDTAMSMILQKLAFDDLSVVDKPKEDACSCEFCNERRNMSSSKVEELKMIQTYWTELRQYIRMVYRFSMKGSIKSIEDEYRCYMKDLMGRLYELCNPHQLYQRLEALVREFVIEIKVRLLQLMDHLAENPQLPKLFISGLLERYNKMMVAADELTPVLHQLESEHLSKFNLTWKLLNQRVFQTSIYADMFFQNSVPLFITQLGKGSDADENKSLVKEFLCFDDEITLVEGIWAEVESRIKLYTQNQTVNFARHRFLTDGWHDISKNFQGQDKLCFRHAKALERYLCSYELDPSAHDDRETIVLGSCECHVCFSTDEVDSSDNPSSNDETKCHGGHEKPSAAFQNNRSSVAETTVDSSDLKCGHSTSDKPTINVDSVNQLLGLGKGQPFKRRADQMSVGDHESTCTLENRIKASKILREFSCTDYLLPHCLKHGHNSKRLVCSEYHPLNNLGHIQNSVLPDSFSSDSQHCDCCYCEVFGHGMPASAPMSKNYKEMRERLRLLLNKKKSKRRTPSGQNTNTSKLHSNIPLVTPPPKITKKTPTPDKPPVVEKETRSLEDLLDYIEGTEVKCRNEKKAAKKARQKEKKQLIIDQLKREEEEKARKLEEERLRKEREAAILEAAKNAQKMALAKKKTNSKSKEDPVPNENNTISCGNQPSRISGGSNSGSQMVTIKRVMEPHESEPTVTITLRGATPKQDKVLYTLFNGQVCDSASSKTTKGPSVTKKDLKTPHVSSKKPSGKNGAPTHKQGEVLKREPKKAENEATTSVPKPKTNKNIATSTKSPPQTNSVSKNGYRGIVFDEIKLPPGITITKVDTGHSKIKPTSKVSREPKAKQGATGNGSKPSSKCSSSPEVIVVSKNNKSKTQSNPTSKDVRSEESRISPNSSSSSKNLKKRKDTDARGELHPVTTSSNVSCIPRPADLARQMSVLSIESAHEGNNKSSNGAKKKKKKAKKTLQPDHFADADEWNFLDNVFAPKDLDLNDLDIDDAERELEAFKLFCMQSVPLPQKEKVNLNLADLVLKKKSPISCT